MQAGPKCDGVPLVSWSSAELKQGVWDVTIGVTLKSSVGGGSDVFASTALTSMSESHEVLTGSTGKKHKLSSKAESDEEEQQERVTYFGHASAKIKEVEALVCITNAYNYSLLKSVTVTSIMMT